MLLSELNMRALGISAETVLPVVKKISIEGREVEFKITAFASGYGSGKKTVVSGSVKRVDNDTTKLFENADIEKVRRVVSSLCELTQSGKTTERKTRTTKEQIEVKRLRQSLAVARRLSAGNNWLLIDTTLLRAMFQEARQADRENARKALQEKAVTPLLAKIEKLSPEERALLLASLQ